MLVSSVSLSYGGLTAASSARVSSSDDGRQHQRDHREAEQLASVERQRASDRARSEHGDRQRVHRGQQGAESRVDDARGHEQAERVGGNAQQVQQERDRGVHVAEHGQQPGAREPRDIRSTGTRVDRRTSRRTARS